MKESLSSWNSYIAGVKGSYTAPHHAIGASVWENQNTTPNGPILGNGDMRTVLLGDRSTQEFCISKSDMWTDEDSRKNVRAIATGGVTLRPGKQISAKRSGFLQEQYFWDATVHGVSEAGFETDAFVAATDNVMFLTIYNKGTEPFPLRIVVWAKEDETCFPVTCGFQQGLLWVSRETSRAPRGNGEPARWVSTSAVAARFLDCEGNAFQVSKGKVEMEIEIPPWQSRCLGVVLEGGKNDFHATKQAVDKAGKLDFALRDRLQAEHREWWHGFWKKSYVNISDRALENFYIGALYLLACVNREGLFRRDSILSAFQTIPPGPVIII